MKYKILVFLSAVSLSLCEASSYMIDDGEAVPSISLAPSARTEGDLAQGESMQTTSILANSEMRLSVSYEGKDFSIGRALYFGMDGSGSPIALALSHCAAPWTELDSRFFLHAVDNSQKYAVENVMLHTEWYFGNMRVALIRLSPDNYPEVRYAAFEDAKIPASINFFKSIQENRLYLQQYISHLQENLSVFPEDVSFSRYLSLVQGEHFSVPEDLFPLSPYFSDTSTYLSDLSQYVKGALSQLSSILHYFSRIQQPSVFDIQLLRYSAEFDFFEKRLDACHSVCMEAAANIQVQEAGFRNCQGEIAKYRFILARSAEDLQMYKNNLASCRADLERVHESDFEDKKSKTQALLHKIKNVSNIRRDASRQLWFYTSKKNLFEGGKGLWLAKYRKAYMQEKGFLMSQKDFFEKYEAFFVSSKKLNFELASEQYISGYAKFLERRLEHRCRLEQHDVDFETYKARVAEYNTLLAERNADRERHEARITQNPVERAQHNAKRAQPNARLVKKKRLSARRTKPILQD